MNLPTLPAHPDCKLCRMHEGANHVGIPTTWMPDSLVPGPNVPAVIICGQNPGREEDAANAPFIGPSGQFLRDIYIDGLNLRARASVYLTNLLRCGPVSITLAGLFNKCWTHTHADLQAIAPFHHEITPIILLVSAPAVKSFFWHICHEHVNQKQSFGMQGRTIELDDYWPLIVFSTFHPAKVMRQNNFILPTKDHLSLLSTYLDGIPLSPSTPTMTPTRSPS